MRDKDTNDGNHSIQFTLAKIQKFLNFCEILVLVPFEAI